MYDIAGYEQEQRHDRRPRSPFLPVRWRFSTLRLIGAIIFTGCFIAVYMLAVTTERGQQIEDWLLGFTNYTTASSLLGLISPVTLATACVGALAIGLLRRRVWTAFIAPLIMIVSVIAGQLLKHLFLDRPTFAEETANTFPSGHMIAFTSVVVALLYAMPKVPRRILVVPAIILLGVVAVMLFAYGWHRPSDILGSILLVCAIACWLTVVDGVPGRRTPDVRAMGVGSPGPAGYAPAGYPHAGHAPAGYAQAGYAQAPQYDQHGYSQDELYANADDAGQAEWDQPSDPFAEHDIAPAGQMPNGTLDYADPPTRQYSQHSTD